MSKWIKKVDKIVVIAGNSKGSTGTVLAKKNDRILVQGINMRKKHMKQRSEQERGGIIEIERAIHISNVALCDADGKALRVGVSVNADGKRELVSRKGGETKVLRAVK